MSELTPIRKLIIDIMLKLVEDELYSQGKIAEIVEVGMYKAHDLGRTEK